MNVSLLIVGGSLSNTTIVKDHYKTFNATKNNQCKSFELFINGTYVDPLKPIMPITIDLKYDTVNKINNVSNEFCETCVVLDPRESKALSTKIRYKVGCKGDRCVSDLALSGKLINVTEHFVIGSAKSIAIQYEVSNSGEPAYNTQLNISIPANVTQFLKVPSSCRLEKNFRDMICDLNAGKPIADQETVMLAISLDTSKFFGESFKISSVVSTASDDQKPANNFKSVEILLTEFSDLELTRLQF